MEWELLLAESSLPISMSLLVETLEIQQSDKLDWHKIRDTQNILSSVLNRKGSANLFAITSRYPVHSHAQFQKYRLEHETLPLEGKLKNHSLTGS
jgi:hypothetical protein